VGYAIYKAAFARSSRVQRDSSTTESTSRPFRQQCARAGLSVVEGSYMEVVHDQAKVENFFAERS